VVLPGLRHPTAHQQQLLQLLRWRPLLLLWWGLTNPTAPWMAMGRRPLAAAWPLLTLAPTHHYKQQQQLLLLGCPLLLTAAAAAAAAGAGQRRLAAAGCLCCCHQQLYSLHPSAHPLLLAVLLMLCGWKLLLLYLLLRLLLLLPLQLLTGSKATLLLLWPFHLLPLLLLYRLLLYRLLLVQVYCAPLGLSSASGGTQLPPSWLPPPPSQCLTHPLHGPNSAAAQARVSAH
jgi:hypothetical protein